MSKAHLIFPATVMLLVYVKKKKRLIATFFYQQLIDNQFLTSQVLATVNNGRK